MKNEKLAAKLEDIQDKLPSHSKLRMTEEEQAIHHIERCQSSIDIINEILSRSIKSSLDINVLKRNLRHLELTVERECIQNCSHSIENIQLVISSAKAYLETL